MVTSLIINQALEDLDDWPLRVEVDRYSYYTNDLEAKHRTLMQLRAEIRTVTSKIHESVFCLSQSNAFQRIKDRAQLNEDVTFSSPIPTFVSISRTSMPFLTRPTRTVPGARPNLL